MNILISNNIVNCFDKKNEEKGIHKMNFNYKACEKSTLG